MAMCHWETDQEHFLVLSGEALLIIEGEERPLRQWDFVHCPPGTKHVIVGAGELPCVVFAVGALEHHTTGSPMIREWGVLLPASPIPTAISGRSHRSSPRPTGRSACGIDHIRHAGVPPGRRWRQRAISG
jgi:hypothetical protein